MKSKHNFTTPKIKQQMLLIFLVVGIFPMLIFGVFSIIHVRNQMLEHYRSQVTADSLRVNSVLFDITTAQYTSTESLTNTQECMLLFGNRRPDEEALAALDRLDSNLALFRQNTAAVSSITIYTNNPGIPDRNHISYVPEITKEEWYNRLGNEWSTWTCLTTTDIVGNPYTELALVKKLAVVSQEYSAYLVLRLDNNYLKNRIEQSDNLVLISVDSLPVFYASDRRLLDSSLPFPEDFNGSYCSYTGNTQLQGQKMLSHIATFTPYKTDNYFYICTNDATAQESVNHMTLLYILIITLAVSVPTLVILLFSSFFSKRVGTLKTAMHRARMGDYNIIDEVKGDDELTETFEDLKATVQMIHEKEARYYESQLTRQQLINRQQQMEFKMLASQINPHFLYNTLETIRMQALAQGNREVATSIKLLGKSMHYVLENTGTSFTTLTRELDYVKTYLAIQKMRFGARVNAEFEIDPSIDTDSCQILPLLLQPIVENAIVHGLENVDAVGHLTISVQTQSDLLLIRIRDNGDGMSAEELQALRERIRNHDPEDTHSIGLYNIDQRIHLLYGEEYGLEVESVLHEGTCVTLRLPADSERGLPPVASAPEIPNISGNEE